jgi:uncharacterized protein YndB with AHSA1/START domain
MSVIEKKIHIDAAPQDVWRHLDDPQLLAGWLMRNDFKPQKGCRFHFWSAPKGEWDGRVQCEVVEIEPPRRLSFTWNCNTIGSDTLVTIELHPHEGGTMVHLRHTNWEGAKGDLPKLIDGHMEGWSDHLWVFRKQVTQDARERTAPPVDWTQFRLFVAIDAPPARLFRAWATSSGLESFFVEMMQIRDGSGAVRKPDTPASAGDRYVWRWDSGAKVEGTFLAVEPEKEVDFTFNEAKVRVRLHPRDGGTLLELHQYGMEDTPDKRMHLHANCRGGWVYFLTVLKTLMEHGVDGRDRSRAMGGAFSTYFDPRDVGLEV